MTDFYELQRPTSVGRLSDMTQTTQTMISQIGAGNILAISGGRILTLNENTIELPVRQGYKVRVAYNPAWDTYTVQRIFVRGTKTWVKGEAVNVYCDQLGDTAYRASCYLDEFEV